MIERLEGKTQDVAGNFLGSEFWKPGTKVTGIVVRKFESVNGECYALELDQPVEIKGQATNEAALGNLAGLRMAIQAAGAQDLQVEDKITLECTGLQPTNKGNSRIDFKIQIERN
jgi:hypothetical protein